MVQISASVLNADFSKWKEWLPQLEEASVERIQFDLMDNHYVHSKGLEEELISQLRPHTKIFFETHVMAHKPESYVERIASRGSDMLIFHIETTPKPDSVIKQIKDAGMQVGIAVNLKTPAKKILPHTSKADLCLVMTVNAGFGGQKFEDKALEKVKELREKIDSEKPSCLIEVDGGVNAKTAKKCVKAGADILTVGTGIFKHPKSIKVAVQELRRA